MGKRIGVDFGGTWLRVGVVDEHMNGGAIDRFDKHATPTDWDHFVKILRPYDVEEVEGFGIAISGPIAEHATVIQAPNLPWLSGRNVRKELETTLAKKVVISNDMEAATEGEMARGILKQFTWAIFDTISTGWGGNLILNGLRVDSEPGHASVTFDSPYRCGSGHVGCREALYSGSGMERRIEECLGTRQASWSFSAELWDIFHRAVDGESDWAIALLDDWAEGVGRSWANMLNCIRPLQAIVYMGMTAESLLPIPRARQRLRETMLKICMYPEHRRPDFPILPAQEEHRAIYGALLVYDRVL
jgi:predicted NBD/HSP70 family sugar kinase